MCHARALACGCLASCPLAAFRVGGRVRGEWRKRRRDGGRGLRVWLATDHRPCVAATRCAGRSGRGTPRTDRRAPRQPYDYRRRRYARVCAAPRAAVAVVGAPPAGRVLRRAKTDGAPSRAPPPPPCAVAPVFTSRDQAVSRVPVPIGGARCLCCRVGICQAPPPRTASAGRGGHRGETACWHGRASAAAVTVDRGGGRAVPCGRGREGGSDPPAPAPALALGRRRFRGRGPGGRRSVGAPGAAVRVPLCADPARAKKKKNEPALFFSVSDASNRGARRAPLFKPTAHRLGGGTAPPPPWRPWRRLWQWR